MDIYIEAQLKEYRNFLPRFKRADEAIEKIFEAGEEPTRKTTREFEKLKKEFLEFKSFFERFDANYWGGELSLTDVADKIYEEFYG